MKNIKGFTLIELIMVTIILGILAAVAIPRFMATVENAEESVEDKVISSIESGLEMYAIEVLIDNGRHSWPTNPFDVWETKPTGYNNDDTDAGDTAHGFPNDAAAAAPQLPSAAPLLKRGRRTTRKRFE